jgi:sulfate adenylyltransferase
MASERRMSLIEPYGGRLVDLLVSGEDLSGLQERAPRLPSVQLSPLLQCDLELLVTGAFSPLDRFMGRDDYLSVLGSMRLSCGTLFPIPIVLPVEDGRCVRVGEEIVLRSPRNECLAVVRVQEVFERVERLEAEALCGRRWPHHPLTAQMQSWGKHCVSGELTGIRLPRHYDFAELRHTPAQLRRLLDAIGNPNVVAFQTRNPIHRAHEEITKRAAAESCATLLLHPAVGMTQPGDIDHYTRVRAYKALIDNYYDPSCTVLSLLPLAMRMAGPREALWHAIIRRNYGASHFIVGRDHAGPATGPSEERFFHPYEARDMVSRYSDELGVKIMAYDEMVYLPDQNRYEQASAVPQGTRTLTLSGSQVRRDYLAAGKALPEWFARKQVAQILAHACPPQGKQGFCVWFTGLPCAGKSTIADILTVILLERGRQVTVLDGDVVRTHLSKGLGFSREDRDANITRIGFVASEIVRHHGVVICAAVSPYRAARSQVREMMGDGSFVEVFVDTPVHVCEQRDSKGMYARARAGQIKGFTGVDDPYEAPLAPECAITTVHRAPEDCARELIVWLTARGLVAEPSV